MKIKLCLLNHRQQSMLQNVSKPEDKDVTKLVLLVMDSLLWYNNWIFECTGTYNFFYVLGCIGYIKVSLIHECDRQAGILFRKLLSMFFQNLQQSIIIFMHTAASFLLSFIFCNSLTVLIESSGRLLHLTILTLLTTHWQIFFLCVFLL